MKTIILLTISNVFMTVAWYGHLKYKRALYLKEQLRWNHVAGFAMIVGAVVLIFKK
jgi:uncharacterized protein (DUF486 family)